MTAYLSLNSGKTAEGFTKAFWPNLHPEELNAKSSRDKFSNQTRRYLGEDHERNPFYPKATPNGGFLLSEAVTSDGNIFQQLIGPNPRHASTEALIAALKLVKGKPFESPNIKLYGWIDEYQTDMVDLICYAAHELAHRGIKNNQHSMARRAARVARLVSPENEQMWRDALLAVHTNGNRPGAEEIAQKLHAFIDSYGDDYEPEDETQDLLEKLDMA